MEKTVFQKVIGILVIISMLMSIAAFAEEEVLDETLAADVEALTMESLLTIPALPGDTENILMDDLVLPTTGAGGSVITWTSSNETVLSSEGRLNRPEIDESVTLTAKLEYNGEATEKQFVFMVPSTSTRINGMPIIKDVLQKADFSGENPLITGADPEQDKIYTNTKGGTATVEDGKLCLTRTINGAEENSAYFAYPSTSGDFVTEFVITRDIAQAARINMWGSAQHIQLEWYAAGEMAIYVSDTEGTEGTVYTIPYISYDSQTRAKITLAVNASRGTISMWINNRLVVYDKYPYKFKSGTAMTSTGTTVYNIKSSLSSIYIEDYQMYTTNFAPDAETVNADYDALLQDDLYVIPPFADGSIIDNLKLPTYGENYSPIKWSSNKPDVIAADGTVTPCNEPTTVRLTAVIGTGENTRSKEFDITVAERNSQLDIPQLISMKNSNQFKNSIPKTVLLLNYNAGWTVAEHGELKLTKKDTSTNVPNAYYLYSTDNQTVSPAHGTFVTEFTVKKEDVTTNFFKAEIWHAGSGSACTLEWQYGGRISGYDGSEWTTFGWENDFGMKDNTLKFSLLINEERQTYSLWVNNQIAVRNKSLRNKTNGGNINGITFYNGMGNGQAAQNAVGTITITDYKYYESMQDNDYDWTDDKLMVTGEDENKQVTYTAKGLYFGTEPQSTAMVILAVKDDKGFLVSADVKQYDFSSESELQLSCDVINASEAMIYIWMPDGSIRPLVNPVKYKISI